MNAQSEQGFWVLLDIEAILEYPCPQCLAEQPLAEIDALPDTTHGFTVDQQWKIDAALCVLDDAAYYGGVRTTLPDGTELWMHRCGRRVNLTPFAAGRLAGLNERIAQGKAQKPVITERLGEVDAP